MIFHTFGGRFEPQSDRQKTRDRRGGASKTIRGATL